MGAFNMTFDSLGLSKVLEGKSAMNIHNIGKFFNPTRGGGCHCSQTAVRRCAPAV
jgi:hypothetical protein